MLVAGVICFIGVGAVQRVFMAGAGAGLAGMAAGLLRLFGMSAPGAAAVLLTVAISMLPAYPLIASWLGRLPVPPLPNRPEGILESQPVPKRSDVFAAVTRSTELLSGMLLSTALIGVAAMVVLVAVATPAAVMLTIAACAALLLRARLFPAPVQRIPLLVSGGLGLVTIAMSSAHGMIGRLVVVAALAATAGAVLAAGLTYSRRAPTPYVGRIADFVDVLAIMALVPLACAVIGVYYTIQGLFASFG
jgi:type VII secretion integral membrane protein EccD